MKVTIETRTMNAGEINKMFGTKCVRFIPNKPGKYVLDTISKHFELLPENHEQKGGFWLIQDHNMKYRASVYGINPDCTILGYFQPIEGALKDRPASDHRSLIFAQCEQLCILLNEIANVIRSGTSVPELGIVAGEWTVMFYDKMLDKLARDLSGCGFEPKFI